MSTKLYIPSLIIFLLSCGTAEEETSASDISADQGGATTDSTVNVNEDLPLEPEIIEEPFYIENLPTTWIQLNEEYSENGERIIYHYCEAETPGLEFIGQKGDDYTLNVYYGQDGLSWTVKNFEAVKQSGANMVSVSGSFELHNQSGGGDIKTVRFYWMLEESFCEFQGLDFTYPYFVSEKNRSNYQEVSEDCEGLWE